MDVLELLDIRTVSASPTQKKRRVGASARLRIPRRNRDSSMMAVSENHFSLFVNDTSCLWLLSFTTVAKRRVHYL